MRAHSSTGQKKGGEFAGNIFTLDENGDFHSISPLALGFSACARLFTFPKRSNAPLLEIACKLLCVVIVFLTLYLNFKL